MGDYKDKILQAKGQVKKAQEDLLNLYFIKIREVYKTSETGKKEQLLRTLDSFISTQTNRIPTRKNLNYDGKEAKDIRKKAGLTTRDLVKQLGMEGTNINSSCHQLGKYELKIINPSNPPRGEFSKKYIGWLKEQGYNPFSL